jgi:hypothetical protein
MEASKMIKPSKTKVVVAFLLFAFLTWAIAQREATGLQGKTETKVSESHKNGKYKRITETFTDKVLTARREEVSLRDDGRINFVFVKLFRDGQVTYASTFDKDKNRTVRSYHHKGKILAMEGDEDGDNFFETLILFNEDEEPVEAFERNKDGTVTLFSKERLSTLKKSFGITKQK